jgi:hypothetical protein
MIRLINSLGAVMDLPVSVTWIDVPLARSVPYERLSGDGAVLAGPRTLEPRTFTLRGSLFWPAREQIRVYHDGLLAFLRHTPIQVYQHHMDTRFLWAEPTGNPQQWIDGRRELQMQLQMMALDPYWYGPEVSDTKTIPLGNGGLMLAVEGTAPTFPILSVSFEGPATGLLLSNANTGQVLDLYGQFTAGDVVTVNTARFAVDVNGVPTMDAAGETWLAGGYALTPGGNELSLETDAGTDVVVSHTWRPRWL